MCSLSTYKVTPVGILGANVAVADVLTVPFGHGLRLSLVPANVLYLHIGGVQIFLFVSGCYCRHAR